MNYIPFILAFFLMGHASAQRYMTREAEVSFLSDTDAIEVVAAINQQVGAVIDLSQGQVAFQLQMRAFDFKIALMEEHFNENYVESDIYPKATFKGKLVEIPEDLSSIQELQVEGVMDLHGVRKQILIPVRMSVIEGKLIGTSEFNLLCSDFNIKIPKIVSDKIANEIEVTVKATLTKI